MEEELKNVVVLVKEHEAGIPLGRLAVFYNQKYHQNLTLSSLGFTSMGELVAALKRDLIVVKKVVFHKTHFYKMKRAELTRVETKKPDDFLENVVSMVKQHPAGIPIKRLTTCYSQTYHSNLTVSSLGFDSITSLVASLDKDLVVREEVVFHKRHQPQNPPGGLRTTRSTKDSRSSTPDRSQSHVDEWSLTPRVEIPRAKHQAGSSRRSVSEPDKQLQLHQKISEVKEKYHLNNPSLEQLQLFYFRHYGEVLSRAECKSLQDGLDACGPKNRPAQAKLTEANDTGVSLTPAAAAHDPPGQQQAASMLDMHSESEFPMLGANKKVPKNQKKDENDATQRQDRVPVFKEAYYAQLRKVHGDNMRAIEAMEKGDDRLPWTGRNRVMDADTVNSLMEDVRRQIAADGDLVTEEKMIFRTCELLQVSSLKALRLEPRTIPALNDLKYIRKEIHMFIKSTEAVSCVCTLYELSQSLAGLKDKKSFEELNLGPICKIPEIYNMFFIDSATKDDDLHQIQTVDILKHLRAFRKKEKKERVDLAEFLKHLSDHYNCDSPYELGIWIRSIGLPLATLKKVKTCEQDLMAQAQEIILRELEDETQDQLRKVKRKVLESLTGAGSSNCDLRKQYTQMTAAEVVLQVFTNAEGVFALRMKRQVQQFLTCVSGDRLARALFQLAICGGSLAVPHDLVPKEKSPRTNKQTEDKVPTPLPSAATVKEFLKNSLSSFSSAVTLGHISSLEKKLSRHFQVKDFPSLQQGSFLEFLVQHIQLLQDTLGSTLVLSSGSVGLTGRGLQPTKQDLFEFIKQCGITSTDPDELSHIESALKSHYRVRDCRDLGYGSLQTLAGLIQHQRGLTGGGQSQVFYESALFSKHGKSHAEGGFEATGLLGEMTTAQALNSLLSCPLLEDLSEWSQWELIFKPLHGSLKDFIERNAGNTGLAALEVTPGSLLRITTHTGDKHFSSATRSLDPVGAAGHLVSMTVADGVDSVPTALLANHMQSSLELAAAKEEFARAEDETSSYSRVAKFVLACLTRIPIRICQTFLQQIFLAPFARALGQAKSKQVLITVARSDLSHMNCLHRLGIVLGITEWEKDYRQKLIPPPAAPVEQIKFNLNHSASSSVSALSSEDENLEENVMDSSFSSSQLNKTQNQVNGKEDVEVEEEEDEEELFEFAPLLNGESSHVTSEAEEVEQEGEEEEEEEEMSEMSDSDEKDDAATFTVQRTIIEDIRKNEFGIGEKMTTKSQRLIQKNQERLGRSLERLSTELYSKDTHFVLELIQNADDNTYPLDAGVVPSVAFVVEKDCITVLNNEIGFQENHIRAICDVGCSTKGKHKYGYIGQKGIGFKSVFKVTDCPEIHSSGFHLRFDRTQGLALGYILPHWTEDERPLDTQLENITQNSWTTKICLPLRAESHHTKNLFHDVHPSLLLFLHRLRSITICNQSENRLVTMTRKDLSHDVVEVEHTEGVERWMVVKTTLQPKQLKEGIMSTELALAFQLCGDDTDTSVVPQPQKQPVFAYLPLRSFGFRFIIQGDFDIPSSREDVDRDSSWNQWLRSEIPQLFLQAMDVFTTHPEFSGLKGLCYFLQFIPLPDEVLDFFKPVAGQITKLLKGKAFLPTLGPDDNIVYKLPSQIAVCQDAVIRNVIGRDELERHLSLSYLHPALSPAPPASLLSHLGVRYLRGSDVTTVTTAMAKELVKVEGIHSDDGLRQLARLLVCNFRALEYGYGEVDSILQCLKDLPIIPLADGRVVALSVEKAFFPIPEETKSKKKKSAESGPLAALYKDVSTVHPSLLSCVEPLESQQVRELLRRLGVHELEPQELLEQHIYPSIRKNKWKSKSKAVVVSYLVFIKQHSSSSQEYSDIAVPVLTNRGLQCPGLDKVHFSEEYGNIDLPNTLPGYDWTLLSPCYVQTDWDVAGWRELFSQLGVRDGFIIRKERQTLTAEELMSSPWSAESAMWKLKPREGCMLDDYPCEEFRALATAQMNSTLLLEQRTALLRLLATNWNSGHHYSQYVTAQVIDSDGRPIKSTNSSFFHFLCRLDWVPAHRQLEGDQCERTYLSPSSVFLTSPEVSGLLGSHVFYVDIDASEFTRALGMRHCVSVDSLIDYLKRWCVKAEAGDPEQGQQRQPEDESAGAGFTTTVQHVHNVYTYLSTNCSQSRLKELFQLIPAVFIEYNRRADGWCSGRFYHLKDVCWSDMTMMFQRYKQLTREPDSPVQEPKLLAPFYSPLEGMSDFFRELLRVDRNPNMKQYVGLLELICSSTPIPTSETLQDVSVLYATLAHKCKAVVSAEQDSYTHYSLNAGYCSTLKGMVSDKRVFPTKDNSWVSLAHKPMISDSKELEKVFKPHQQVCLLNLPPAEKKAAPTSKSSGHKVPAERANVPNFSEAGRSLFMEICGIHLLSQCVKTEPQTENLRPCPPMQALVRSIIPYIQKFLYHHEELAHVYSDLVANNIGQKIKRLQFGQVGKLYIRYQLDVADSDTALVELQDVICVLKEEKELYIQKDHLSARLEICRELVKLFCTESSHRKELMHFLSALITSLSDAAALKRLLQKDDIRDLPADEERWEVPEPPTPEVHLERVPQRSLSSSVNSPEEPVQPAHQDRDTLACWPPRASTFSTGGVRAGKADGGVVDAVMKMWPPPPGPKDQVAQKEAAAPREGGHVVPQSPSSCEGKQLLRSISSSSSSSSSSSRPPDQPNLHRSPSQTGQPHPAAVNNDTTPQPPVTENSQQTKTTESVTEPQPEPESRPSGPPAETVNNQPAPKSHFAPEAVVRPGAFQGTVDKHRPPLNLDAPLWIRDQAQQAKLEDMTLTCQIPSTVVMSEEQMDVVAIGEWGEQLVNSFLCHWRDSGEAGHPTHVLWCNRDGESGLPYDFKLTFGASEEVFVEVKSTVKTEKAFIHLSVNELDFALREKERYHVYRVYNAGDAASARLCRVKNLAQHLYTKDLSLYLFV